MLNPTNPQHLQLRRLLAEIVAKHANCLATLGYRTASRYRQMANGMARVCVEVLNDGNAAQFCYEVEVHLFYMEEAARTASEVAA